MTDHLRLEKEVLEISEAERRRIGQDLHDTLGQTLTGVLFLTRILEQTLASRTAPEAKDAAEIVAQVIHAIDTTRALSRGLVPVEMRAEGLMNGLKDFAHRAQQVMGIACQFEPAQPVLIHDSAAASHLYRIAQEATNNAVKHGRASRVEIRLATDGDRVTLTIEDDGIGLPDGVDPNKGMGLRIMTYRARMIGGQLTVRRRNPAGGTVVECTFRPPREGTAAGRAASAWAHAMGCGGLRRCCGSSLRRMPCQRCSPQSLPLIDQSPGHWVRSPTSAGRGRQRFSCA